jgi:hypothetical protein
MWQWHLFSTIFVFIVQENADVVKHSGRRSRHGSPGVRMNTVTKPLLAPALENDLAAISAANTRFLGVPRRLLIDNAWVKARSGRTFDVRDPSSDRVIARAAERGSVNRGGRSRGPGRR